MRLNPFFLLPSPAATNPGNPGGCRALSISQQIGHLLCVRQGALSEGLCAKLPKKFVLSLLRDHLTGSGHTWKGSSNATELNSIAIYNCHRLIFEPGLSSQQDLCLIGCPPKTIEQTNVSHSVNFH